MRAFCFDPATREIYQTEVKQLFRHFVPRTQILHYEFEHAALNVTPEHNIETIAGKCAAGQLTAQTEVFGFNRRGVALTPSAVKSFAWDAGNDLVEVFNFEAARLHTYLANDKAVYKHKDENGLLLF